MEIADSDNLELISRLEELENKLKNSEDLKNKYFSKLETLQHEVTDLKKVQKKPEEFEKINTEFRKSQSENEKLRRELTNVSEANENFKKEAQKWKDKHDALEGQIDTLDKELTKCKEKNTQLISEAKASSTALFKAQSQVAKMEEASTTRKRKLDEMESNHTKEIEQLKVSHATHCAAQSKQIAEKIRNLADSISGKEKS
jgi:chromosome segregation ATPase